MGNVSDLISRRDAIDAICQYLGRFNAERNYKQWESTAKIILEYCPSVQPDYEKIIAEIKQCITETREHGKHHAKFVQDNGELYISGLEMALSIIEENR